MKYSYLLLLLAAAVLLHPAAWAGDAVVAEPEGYRMDGYKSPVPSTLRGATVIGVGEAERLWAQKAAIFLDVMPRIPKPDKLPRGTIWVDKPRHNIPGSMWLANTGYGALTPEMEHYFRGGLVALTSGDRTRKLVFYCMTDCWMSWNAAKRAVVWGYRAVSWYPEGADGWEAANLPLAEAQPYRAP